MSDEMAKADDDSFFACLGCALPATIISGVLASVIYLFITLLLFIF